MLLRIERHLEDLEHARLVLDRQADGLFRIFAEAVQLLRAPGRFEIARCEDRNQGRGLFEPPQDFRGKHGIVVQVVVVPPDFREPAETHAQQGIQRLVKPADPAELTTLQRPVVQNGVADEKEIIQRAPLEGLFLIPSGTPAKNPAELIASPSMSVLLDSMAEHFDWIVIDCPPCVPVADARVIAAHCDGVLLVVRAEATPAELTVKAKRQFKEQSLLGVVLNRAAGTGRYGSYYYGAYGVSQDSATASSVKL